MPPDINLSIHVVARGNTDNLRTTLSSLRDACYPEVSFGGLLVGVGFRSEEKLQCISRLISRIIARVPMGLCVVCPNIFLPCQNLLSKQTYAIERHADVSDAGSQYPVRYFWFQTNTDGVLNAGCKAALKRVGSHGARAKGYASTGWVFMDPRDLPVGNADDGARRGPPAGRLGKDVETSIP